MRKPTIYIAGPMRGYPNWNYDTFHYFSKELKKIGWNVINPAEMDKNLQKQYKNINPHNFSPDTNDNDQEFLRKALKDDMAIICDECTAIYLLKGWENSKGAKTERCLAIALGLDVLYELAPPHNHIGK